ncbi:hypothetical protein [Paraferrimonas haliotis]|uniref:Uncharacterized protein n=1 Tax=Paraferrimonas haliotis TaxID=2013866 RepID=A0AA37WZU0_9GAMM|nr:hypothetical protein [Paraferrimonas haliotis]GLS84186.1 hypothetical protein GCM10007894_21630 [Paraferrimonas haliotis]
MGKNIGFIVGLILGVFTGGVATYVAVSSFMTPAPSHTQQQVEVEQRIIEDASLEKKANTDEITDRPRLALKPQDLVQHRQSDIMNANVDEVDDRQAFEVAANQAQSKPNASIPTSPFDKVSEMFDSQSINQESDWSVNTEVLLEDFVILHEHSAVITLDSVECKNDICKMQLTSQDHRQINDLLGDMRLTEQWPFVSTVSYSRNDPESNELTQTEIYFLTQLLENLEGT